MYRFIQGGYMLYAVEAFMLCFWLALMSMLGGGIVYALVKELVRRDAPGNE
jgi:hypothetical protein